MLALDSFRSPQRCGFVSWRRPLGRPDQAAMEGAPPSSGRTYAASSLCRAVVAIMSECCVPQYGQASASQMGAAVEECA
jgi:hypothetical protein